MLISRQCGNWTFITEVLLPEGQRLRLGRATASQERSLSTGRSCTGIPVEVLFWKQEVDVHLPAFVVGWSYIAQLGYFPHRWQSSH